MGRSPRDGGGMVRVGPDNADLLKPLKALWLLL